jgi:Protein of unknown function (DUF2459)
MARSIPASLPGVLLACCALLVGCSSAPPHRAQQPPAGSPEPSTIIYVVKRAWHVDIGFAAADLQPPLARLRSELPNARFVLFGFGDRHYLLDQDRGPFGMLAALWPGPGLMLVTGLDGTAQAAFGETNVVEIRVSAQQALDAQQFVALSLTAAQDGAVAPLRPGPYPDSLYYVASQPYSAWHTCNTWAAEALHAAGLPVHSAGVALSGQLWIQARRLDARN